MASSKPVEQVVSEFQMRPDLVSARMTAQGGHLDLLEWLGTWKVPLTNCVHQALKRGHLEVVGWLLQRGHRPHQKVVDRLCAQGRLEDLVWFNSRGVEISQRGVELAIEKNQDQVIERGIFPTKNYVENILILISSNSSSRRDSDRVRSRSTTTIRSTPDATPIFGPFSQRSNFFSKRSCYQVRK